MYGTDMSIMLSFKIDRSLIHKMCSMHYIITDKNCDYKQIRKACA